MLTLLVSLGCGGGVVVVVGVGGSGLEVTPHQSERSLPICVRILVFAVIKCVLLTSRLGKKKRMKKQQQCWPAWFDGRRLPFGAWSQ